MYRFHDLNREDRAQLLKYPVYISLLASMGENGLDKKELKTALKLTHLKTFAGDTLVADFYREEERHFIEVLRQVVLELPKEKSQIEGFIVQEVKKLNHILKKVPPKYADAFLHSLHTYRERISKAHHSWLEYFIFPVPIKGLSD